MSPVRYRSVAVILILLGGLSGSLPAAVVGQAIKEVAETVIARFGKGAAGATVKEVAERTARLVQRHGDSAADFVRGGGHVAVTALERAGDQAPVLLSLHRQHGARVFWLVEDAARFDSVLRFGDEAGTALIKHPGIAGPVLDDFGAAGAGALARLSTPQAQRLGQMTAAGTLGRFADPPGTLGVIRRHGDQAMDFVWRHKGVLIGAAVLAAFLDDPEPYLTGARELVVEPVLAPAARQLPWTFLVLAAVLLLGGPWILLRLKALLRAARKGPEG